MDPKLFLSKISKDNIDYKDNNESANKNAKNNENQETNIKSTH